MVIGRLRRSARQEVPDRKMASLRHEAVDLRYRPEASDYRLAADALLLAQSVGLRIGELLDLELDCVHEIPGHGAWLKVPLGKLETKRMVPSTRPSEVGRVGT